MSVRSRSMQGRSAEVELIHELQADGWICASRRHIAGPGDILAVKPKIMVTIKQGRAVRPLHDVALIEVKQTADGPWRNFGPRDRLALSQAAATFGALAVVCWRKDPEDGWEWLSENLWPS